LAKRRGVQPAPALVVPYLGRSFWTHTFEGSVDKGSTFGRAPSVVIRVRLSDSPAVKIHGVDGRPERGSPSASQPPKRTGPQSSARARAPRKGDLPQPFARRRTARRCVNAPRSSIAYHQSTKLSCSRVNWKDSPARSPSGWRR
jgi:hypothetical protein